MFFFVLEVNSLDARKATKRTFIEQNIKLQKYFENM